MADLGNRLQGRPGAADGKNWHLLLSVLVRSSSNYFFFHLFFYLIYFILLLLFSTSSSFSFSSSWMRHEHSKTFRQCLKHPQVQGVGQWLFSPVQSAQQNIETWGSGGTKIPTYRRVEAKTTLWKTLNFDMLNLKAYATSKLCKGCHKRNLAAEIKMLNQSKLDHLTSHFKFFTREAEINAEGIRGELALRHHLLNHKACLLPMTGSGTWCTWGRVVPSTPAVWHPSWCVGKSFWQSRFCGLSYSSYRHPSWYRVGIESRSPKEFQVTTEHGMPRKKTCQEFQWQCPGPNPCMTYYQIVFYWLIKTYDIC